VLQAARSMMLVNKLVSFVGQRLGYASHGREAV
jgi:hypothetical protein